MNTNRLLLKKRNKVESRELRRAQLLLQYVLSTVATAAVDYARTPYEHTNMTCHVFRRLRVGRSVGGVMKTRKPPTFVLSYIFYIPTIVSPSCVVTCLTVLLRHSYSMANGFSNRNETYDFRLAACCIESCSN